MDGGQRRLFCVTVGAYRGVTGSRPLGWVERQPGGILLANRDFGIFRGEPGHLPQLFPSIFPFKSQPQLTALRREIIERMREGNDLAISARS